jgi:hypothetical protein
MSAIDLCCRCQYPVGQCTCCGGCGVPDANGCCAECRAEMDAEFGDVGDSPQISDAALTPPSPAVQQESGEGERDG